MNVKEAIKARHSVRSYTDMPIPPKVLDDIILHAHRAPSAGNLQARDFIIVDDPFIKEALCKAAYDQEFLREAPVTIVVCANLSRIKRYGKRGQELYCLQDSAAAVENILLLAVEYGLATCWVGAFKEGEVKTILKLPDFVRPIAIIPIGHQNTRTEPTSRLPIEQVTHQNSW